MDEKQYLIPGEWETLIRKEFINAWNERSPVDVTAYLYKIEDHFHLEHIARQLAANPEKSAFYGVSIQTLAAAFCEALLEFSDDAKQLSGHHISQAKYKMLTVSTCREIEI